MATASGFRVAAAMADVGIRMMRQRLRREDAEASEDEIDARLVRWLHDRPMDAPGRVRSYTSE